MQIEPRDPNLWFGGICLGQVPQKVREVTQCKRYEKKIETCLRSVGLQSKGSGGLSLITWHSIYRDPLIAYLHDHALLAKAIHCFVLITRTIVHIRTISAKMIKQIRMGQIRHIIVQGLWSILYAQIFEKESYFMLNLILKAKYFSCIWSVAKDHVK